MSLKDQLNEDLKSAMKSGEKVRTETLRSLKSAIKYAEIQAGNELDDNGVLGVVRQQAKQRRDSIAEFEKGNRADLIEKEAAELAVLEKYLPAQLPEAEIEAKARAVIAALGVTDARGTGQVMKQLMAELKGQADGSVINQVVRRLLA
ncbi:MAG: GatB/YqeY domain-containing protein [Anaerolineae bacterium]|nr:GatB/YqeY domain-containing protein [Anaerolineales bacterium]MCQ3975763.1 GatB/YqeY domain-containing protein [Anaerolineae bacterium]